MIFGVILHIVPNTTRSHKHTREGVQKRRKGQKKGEKGLTTGKIGDRITTLFPRGDREKSLTYHEKTLKKLKKALDKRGSNVIE